VCVRVRARARVGGGTQHSLAHAHYVTVKLLVLIN